MTNREELTSADPSGWYECETEFRGRTVKRAYWWDGKELRGYQGGHFLVEMKNHRNFRPLAQNGEEVRELLMKHLRRQILLGLPGIVLTKRKERFIDTIAQRCMWAVEHVGLMPRIDESRPPAGQPK